MINLSSTTPAAANGGVLVTWQSDSSGNVSAYASNAKATVSSVSGVLTLDASAANSFLVPVTEAITSMSITNPSDGQEITILWSQDGTGHSIVLAANLNGATAPSTSANTQSCQRFTYNVGDTNWYSCGVGSTGM